MDAPPRVAYPRLHAISAPDASRVSSNAESAGDAATQSHLERHRPRPIYRADDGALSETPAVASQHLSPHSADTLQHDAGLLRLS